MNLILYLNCHFQCGDDKKRIVFKSSKHFCDYHNKKSVTGPMYNLINTNNNNNTNKNATYILQI